MKTFSQTYRITFVLLLFLSFSSCSNDDDSAPEPTTEELLANKWFLKITEDLSATPPTSTVANACQQNTYFNFLSTGELLAEEFDMDMNDTCLSNSITTFTYSLTANDSQIIVTDGDEPTILALESINETQLILSVSSQRITFER